MPQLRKPLYQRTEGADEDRWRLVSRIRSSHHLAVSSERTSNSIRTLENLRFQCGLCFRNSPRRDRRDVEGNFGNATLVLDTDGCRLFVEHEKTRGDMRGSGFATSTDEMDVAAFLNENSPGQHELMRLLGALFEDAPRP